MRAVLQMGGEGVRSGYGVSALPVAVLGAHSACVNAVAWAPHSSCHICTAGDDNQALIWDLAQLGQKPISGTHARDARTHARCTRCAHGSYTHATQRARSTRGAHYVRPALCSR